MKLNLKKTSFLAWLLFSISVVVTLGTLPSHFTTSDVQGSGLKIVDVLLKRQPSSRFPWLVR
jgi:uncharacterized protein (DUF2336 family)